MKPFATSLVVALQAALLVSVAHAANWPHWRGPDFNGSSPETRLPDNFSKTNGVQWVADLPGPSAATPIIWGDHVFISSTDVSTKTLRAICFDFKTGKELWNHQTGIGFNQDQVSNFACPSPVTDGKLVYFYYGTGDLVAFDFSGNVVWSRNIQKDYGPFVYMWTYSSSPTLFKGKLFIQVLQRNVAFYGRGRKDGPNDSYLLALNPKDGKEIWKHIRPSKAVGEAHEAYSTPIPFEYHGRYELAVIGGDCITGHDLNTGEELWRWGTWNPTRITHWRLVPSPVAGDGVVLACAPKGSPIYAVKMGSKGVISDKDLAWISKERAVSSDVGTPLFYQGRFYVLNPDKRTLARVDPATGKADWIGEMDTRSRIECSPTGADGKIYFQDFRGKVFVVAAADQFKVLHVAAMGDEGDSQVRAEVAVSQRHLFIRSGSKLYCIGRRN